MNADEVCRMIDAITDGREYIYTLGKNVEIISDREGVDFWAPRDCPFSVIDPRLAREIAGLLVAWANAKEKNQ